MPQIHGYNSEQKAHSLLYFFAQNCRLHAYTIVVAAEARPMFDCGGVSCGAPQLIYFERFDMG